MKPYYTIILVALISLISFSKGVATMQQPDRLTYKDLKLGLSASWAFPSPLEIYYHQTGIKYPFKGTSTANYRGFIANWEIKDDKLFLYKIEVGKKQFNPQHFKVKSNDPSYNEEKEIFADWFSGVIECSFRKKDDFNYITSYYFQIREGVIIEQEMTSGRIPNSDYFSNLEELKLYKMYNDYTDFFFQRTDDQAILAGEAARWNINASKPSPLLSYYGENPIDFKYNWENREKNGYPNCTWVIQNDEIYLKDLSLRYGSHLDTSYLHKIDLQEEFGDRFQNNQVKADWLTGVWVLKFGELITKKTSYGFESEEFQIDRYIFIRVKNGKILEKHTANHDFNFRKLPMDINPALRRIIKDYLSPS